MSKDYDILQSEQESLKNMLDTLKVLNAEIGSLQDRRVKLNTDIDAKRARIRRLSRKSRRGRS